MWRWLHSLFGIGGMLLVALLALTGAIMSVVPAVDALGPYVRPAGDLSVAQALAVLTPKFDEIEKLQRTPAGAFVLTHRQDGTVLRDYVDVSTGAVLGPQQDSAFFEFVKDLHRSLRLGNAGRLVAGIGAGLMTLLCVTGATLLIKRFGGIRAVFGPVRGKPMEKLHATSGRIALVPLLLTGLTGLYLTLVTFLIIPSGNETPPRYPESLEELDPVPASDLAGLQQIALSDLRQVTYPIPGDWFDVYALKTSSGFVFVDQFSGETLDTQPYHPATVGLEWVTLLHTGEGAWLWGLILGLTALSVPIFAVSGFTIWLARLRQGGARVPDNATATNADMIVLVGSETGTTWGFARHLHEKLSTAGRRVHLAALNDLRPAYPKAQGLLVLTGTYGDGHAPKSANRFKPKLSSFGGHLPAFAVLGFGDKSFEHYCRFSLDADAAIAASGAQRLLPPAQVDRGSAHAFAQWGQDLGAVLELPLALSYVPPRPATQPLMLVERIDYGTSVDAPTAILRFKSESNGVPHHVAGDLIGVIAPGTQVARYYSLASNAADGCVEICVRHMQAGLCSGFLHGLTVGAQIDAYVRTNPEFHLPRRKSPVVMVGAGTGIAPFIGMIRSERGTRPIELYWGGRKPDSDFLYETTTRQMLETGRLARFDAAFSRGASPAYVQDRIRANAAGLLERLHAGATIMVCGSSAMAAGVRAEFDIILAGLDSDVATLRRQRRYLEDIY
ncbi:MAG: nitric oxide synthase [Devosia sp.]|uniref:PepSY domain-containing protein n=1 Tax=Devosia sp. TaxID=1871048 RepID=UPI00261B08F0|nr:PepSY domain-containing protein [Devosia sp.]MDB5528442.1 nitric oxide synthase [Devosia sp.]